MTPNENFDVAEILQGYEAWRRVQVDRLQSSDYHLSVSHYLDAIARDRALDACNELAELFNNFDLPLEDIYKQARAILGVGQVEPKR